VYALVGRFLSDSPNDYYVDNLLKWDNVLKVKYLQAFCHAELKIKILKLL